MKKTSFNYPVKLSWLKHTLRMICNNVSNQKVIMRSLSSLLKPRYSSSTRNMIARTIISNFKIKFEYIDDINRADMNRLKKSELIFFSYLNLMNNNSLFFETANIIGRYVGIYRECSIETLWKEISKIFGEFPRIKRSMMNIVSTLQNLNLISQSGRKIRWNKVRPEIKNKVLLNTYIEFFLSKNSAMMPTFTDLKRESYMGPFQLRINKTSIDQKRYVVFKRNDNKEFQVSVRS